MNSILNISLGISGIIVAITASAAYAAIQKSNLTKGYKITVSFMILSYSLLGGSIIGLAVVSQLLPSPGYKQLLVAPRSNLMPINKNIDLIEPKILQVLPKEKEIPQETQEI